MSELHRTYFVKCVSTVRSLPASNTTEAGAPASASGASGSASASSASARAATGTHGRSSSRRVARHASAATVGKPRRKRRTHKTESAGAAAKPANVDNFYGKPPSEYKKDPEYRKADSAVETSEGDDAELLAALAEADANDDNNSSNSDEFDADFRIVPVTPSSKKKKQSSREDPLSAEHCSVDDLRAANASKPKGVFGRLFSSQKGSQSDRPRRRAQSSRRTQPSPVTHPKAFD